MDAKEAMDAITEILYPNDDPEALWASDEIEWVAEVVLNYHRSLGSRSDLTGLY